MTRDDAVDQILRLEVQAVLSTQQLSTQNIFRKSK